MAKEKKAPETKAKKARQPAKAKAASKAAKPKAKAKPRAAPKPALGGLQALEKEAAKLEAQVAAMRKAVFENEKALNAKIGEKMRLDDLLNTMLRKAFVDEKNFLSKIKSGAKKEEAGLMGQIASLERVNSVFEAKKVKVLEAKKRQFALKKQLQELEKQAEVLGPYA
ncbi:MAG: hypothetical protein NTW59_04405 [Candidatus Diapherotrites archaeon]|nr:hypothetical protein [Candidatus Diapherotrites archaeon]